MRTLKCTDIVTAANGKLQQQCLDKSLLGGWRRQATRLGTSFDTQKVLHLTKNQSAADHSVW
jgi:hypothetical protein